jgi:hypothetical protein
MTTHAKPTKRNGHKPAAPAPVRPAMPACLNVGINQINLFGQTVAVQAPAGTFDGYAGNPLFIAGITLTDEPDPVLVFDINDEGPPVNWPDATAFTNAVPARATLTCKQLGTSTYQTANTPNTVTYSGGPIVIVGTLGQDGNLIPEVAAWQTPDDGNVDYVLVLSQGNVIEVRWIDNAPAALETQPPMTAYVVMPAPGPGVAGPFGFGTPTP